eukprot:TRINITY_DN2383_c0_g1_i1.p1 TRINITY_DN2383_c0_g1~~TRINITY_DN2383_c0_g1_i1.p1  ORF type:complete len:366 (+),score=28.96 TRINITY_DN2383_c0_g1_i1:1024-2121(+)
MRILVLVCQFLICLSVDWQSSTHNPMGLEINYKEKRDSLVNWARQNNSTDVLQTHLGYVGACLMVKNEHSSIREWVQYHLWLGVSKIYVIDNASIPPLSVLLLDFIQKGQVDVFYYTTTLLADDYEFDRQGNQNSYIKWGLNSCLQWYGHRHQWMLNLDVDEFVMFPNDLNMKLPAFLQQYEDYGVVHIYRKYFSSGGYMYWPNGTVLESYTSCVPDVETLKKGTRYKYALNMQYFTGRASVHWVRSLRPHVNGLGIENTKYNVQNGIFQPTFEGICLYHYYIKSYEELRLKWERRFVSTTPNGFQYISQEALAKKVDKYFNMINDLASETCLQGVELAKMCCSDIQNIPPNFTDWNSIIKQYQK